MLPMLWDYSAHPIYTSFISLALAGCVWLLHTLATAPIDPPWGD